MRPIAIACYVLAVLGLALSVQVGWAAAVVSCVALVVGLGHAYLEKRESRVLDAVAAQAACARADSEKASEDVKRLRTELHATLEQMKRTRGGL